MDNSSGRIEQRHRLRDEPPPHDTVVVLRGGTDTAAKIAIHAARTQRRWAMDGVPLYGVSVLCALDPDGPASRAGILADLLGSYRMVHQVPARRLVVAGFALLPTAGRPHYTLKLPSDDPAVGAALLALLGRPRKNPHHTRRAFP